MKKKNPIIPIVSVLLILTGLVGSLFIKESLAERLVSVITTGTAVAGAVALFYQFKKDKNLNEASFLVEYAHQFYATYNCAELMNELENCRMNPEYRLDVDKYYQQIVGYLEWLETLASLVTSGALQIPKIDNVMSYKYFLIVNNKQIQEGELTTNQDFYRSIYAIYSTWIAYKKKNNLPIIFEENDLRNIEGYDKIVKP